MNQKPPNLTTPAAQLLVSSQLALARERHTDSFAAYLRGKRWAAKFVLIGCPRPQLRDAIRKWIQYYRIHPNYV